MNEFIVQADMAAEEAAATENALGQRQKALADMEASVERREVALGEAVGQLDKKTSTLHSAQQALEQEEARIQATGLEAKVLQVRSKLSRKAHTRCIHSFDERAQGNNVPIWLTQRAENA